MPNEEFAQRLEKESNGRFSRFLKSKKIDSLEYGYYLLTKKLLGPNPTYQDHAKIFARFGVTFD